MKPATDTAANAGGDSSLIAAIVIGAVIVAFAIIVAVAMVLRNKNKKD
jgi:flagellar basal body-associated protein FliL